MSQNNNVKISGLIITYNEEKNIREVIECLDFVEEIIVLDSFSSDRTVEIAASYPKVKVIQNKFLDYTSQRNLALKNASNNWVLFLDADERITPELKEEILNEVNKPETRDAYFFLRKFYFNQKPIHFSGTQTDKNYRLFKKEKAHYIPERLVHETLKVDGTVGILKNKLLHYSYDNYEVYKKKMINYGVLKGKELFLKGKKYSIFTHYLKTVFKFIRAYLLRLGILDGKSGFILSYLQALSVHHTYKSLKITQKQNI
ncbi:glycosyltransferase family 2 protein [Flavobacterium sp. UBA4197]|uniref:glycosyltransferase family 2 protein n=1 Tax=Flavobacterium sp. UBA4197 TaxID=1946546 RepID=UPI002580576C|nr:glycosyltransferase family 2 protein [Flavobacterium sp. UBA4197]